MTTSAENEIIRVAVDPGICGFHCTVAVQKKGSGAVEVAIAGSECKQIQTLATLVKELALADLFAPTVKNKVFQAAVKAACHPPCAVPIAVLKAAEVALGLALKRDVRITFNE